MNFIGIDRIGWYTPRPWLCWALPCWYFGERITGDGWHV